MVEDLKLRGSALLVCAILFGLTQDNQFHQIRLSYLQAWTNLSKPQLSEIINTLYRREIIEKQTESSSQICSFRVNQETLTKIQIEKKRSERHKEELKEEKKKNQLSSWEQAEKNAEAVLAAEERAKEEERRKREASDQEEQEKIRDFLQNHDFWDK